MKVIRETPTVINEPLVVLNTHRAVFGGALITCALLAFNWRLDVSVGLFLVTCVSTQILSKKDMDAVALVPAIWRFLMDRAYDPCERELFTLVITEDSNEEEE
jgi:hypothetical protein